MNTIVWDGFTKPGMWRVNAATYVITRLKRVIPKVNEHQHGEITLLDSIENCRELWWFLDRYPFELGEGDFERLRVRAAEHERREQHVGEILSGEYQPPAHKLSMALPPRDYQIVAASLCAHTGELLLADQVGLGKTASSITLLSMVNAFPCLVITLTHLPKQWTEEINRFLPGLRIETLKTGYPKPWKNGWPDVIITNYHKLKGWADTLHGKIRTVIADEIQDLRHANTGKYSAAKRIFAGTDFRCGLSATPIHNYGGEIFNLMDLISPDCLGARGEFEREWCSWKDGKAILKDPAALGQYLRDRGLMLRRTRSEINRELGPLQNIHLDVEVDMEAIQAVSTVAMSLARILMDPSEKVQGAKMKAGGELSYKLREATGLAKAPFVAEFVDMLISSGEKVLLAGWHHRVYEKWRKLLHKHSPQFFTGTETAVQKQLARDNFLKPRSEGGSDLLIMSLRSGAGIDGLQNVCSVAVYGELDWSPSVHIQFTGRLHRDGQQNQVLAYFPVADVGSDPVIADALGVKRNQLDGILDPTASPVVETNPAQARRLAIEFLRQQGHKPKLDPLDELELL